jgi:hypothetical protein
MIPKEKTKTGFGEIIYSIQTVQDTLEEKLGATGSESGNVEVQWNSVKEWVLDTNSALVGKVRKRTRKPWITQEMIYKMDERRKWKNVNTEEGRSCKMQQPSHNQPYCTYSRDSSKDT